MENNLDKYFRDNLSNRKFEPSESDWLGAEQLLEADERRRKRRGLIWWFTGGGLVLGLLVTALFILNTDDKKDAAEPPVSIAQGAGEAPTNSSIAADEQSSKINSNTINNDSININNETLKSAINSTEPTKSEKPISSNLGSKQALNEAKNQLKTVEKTRSANNLIDNKSNLKNGIAFQDKNHMNSNTISTAEGKTVGKLTPTNESAQLPIIASENLVERIANLDFLAILTPMVIGNFDKQNLETTTQKIEVETTKHWHLSLMAAEMGQAPISGEKTLLGQRMGLLLRRDLRNDWYVATGLLYQRRVGTFDASDVAQQRNYRFGLELDTVILRPTSLHYASLPILVGFERKKHQLEGGVLLDYLTGVRGEIGSYQKQGEPPVKAFEREKNGWMTTDGYNRLVPTAQFGYHYLIARRWSVGLSANYLMGNILDKNYEPPFGSFRMKETGKLSFMAQLTYRIN